MIFDEFHYKRDWVNGKCVHCNRYNTSPAWCQTCNPRRTAQGWTSGNTNVDDCIKGFQLKTTEYVNVIEWIPFNKLDVIQNNNIAIWLDGIRIVSGYDHKNEYTQLRTPPYIITLKRLQGSHNLIDLLREVS